MIATLLGISLGLLGPSDAFAFRDDGATPLGEEPVRLRRVHVGRQARLRAGAAWQGFVAGEGAGWQVRFDEKAGTPLAAWGPGIDLGVSGDDPDATAAALLDFFARHADLIGVSVDDLRLAAVRPAREHTVYRFDRVVPLPDGAWDGGVDGGDLGGAGVGDPGLPDPEAPDGADSPLWELARWGEPVVWGGALVAHVRDGRLFMFRAETYPGAEAAASEPLVDADDAIAIAVEQGLAPQAEHAVDGAVLVVFPREAGSGLDHRLAWAVLSRTGSPRGDWLAFVDARTGELLNVSNRVRFLSGTVYGEHDTRTVDGDTSVSPLPGLRVSSSAGSTYADDDGAFSLSGSGLSVDGLVGDYVSVRNRAGRNGGASWTDGDYTLTEADATLGEIDSYVFIEHMRAWGEAHAPDLGIVTDGIASNVNMNSYCNAYYDGSVNFYRSGGGCNNTARIADVEYHEWGHGLHAYAAGTWYVDGSLGEGAGDTTAFLQTGDSEIGPYFWTSGEPVRDVEPDRVYPDDWVGEVHEDGLIFAGAMWDLYQILAGTEGDEEARAIVSDIFVDALRTNPSIDTSYDAVVAADDDDGDLSNGTPHYCAIIRAFGEHGLGPGQGTSLLQLGHDPLRNQPDTADGYPVEAEVVNTGSACADAEIRSAVVVWSADGGESWQETPLDVSDGVVSGEIPAVDPETVVSYYIEVDGGEAGTVTAPSGGAINPFSFYVGNTEEIRCDSFELDDGGYTHELLGGDDEEGADDWQWGTPQGLSGDPDFAWSGDRVWGNDLGGGNYDGAYQNSKHNRLSSAPFDVSGEDRVVVQFRRWLTVEDGYYDQASVLANDAVIWQNHATSRSIGDEHTQDEQWAPATFIVDLDGADSLTLAWDLQSDGGLTFGGWNIDDVCVYRIAAPTPADPGDTGGPEGGPAGLAGGELTGCGCSSAGGGSAFALASLLGLLGLARRREGGA